MAWLELPLKKEPGSAGWNQVPWEGEGCLENWGRKALEKREMLKGIVSSVSGVKFVKTA